MPKRAPDVSPYRSRHFLLTRNERAFYQALRNALGGRWLLFAKVRLADVVTCPESLWDQVPGRRIAQKHLDFVVCHPVSLRIVAAIELDDRSHARPRRQQRDAFVNRLFRRVGIPLLRYQARSMYAPRELKNFWESGAWARSYRIELPSRQRHPQFQRR
ncbi:MAG: DUF2726 domain-containing protein [Gemmataceae bacterium]|nr:DUF2726 domain-containing protein [Gemmataceae bacterium]